MLAQFLRFDALSKEFKEIDYCFRQGVPTAIFNLSDSQKCHIASGIKEKVLYVVKDNLSLEKTATYFRQLTDKKVAVIYAKDDVLLYANSFSKYSLFKRLNGLYDAYNGAEIVVCSIEALLQLFPLKIERLVVKKDGVLDIDLAVKRLVKMGYKREDFISGQGSFSLRGDILEIFPINLENPVRIDFFGDEVENIKAFNLETREGLGFYKEIEIITATDVIIDDDERAGLISEIKKERSLVTDTSHLETFNNLKEGVLDCLGNGTTNDGIGVIMPLLRNTSISVFDFVKGDVTVVFDECKAINDTLSLLIKEHTERALSIRKSGGAFSFCVNQFIDEREVVSSLVSHKVVAVQKLTASVGFFSPLKTFSLNVSSVPKYQLKLNELMTDLKNWVKNKYKVVICTETKGRAEELSKDIAFLGCGYVIDKKEDGFNGVTLLTESLDSGFIYHDSKLVVIGSGDIYTKPSERVKPKRIKKKKNEFFSAPEIGDIAVHEVHGIGVVKGTKRISSTEGTKDYIAVEYYGGDVLYVPVEQTDVLSRYLGGDKKPQLSKIGGKDFERIKQRAREAIKKMSFDLKELYAERGKQTGFRFSEDDEMQTLFEEAFPFDETADQIIASNEIMEDMCSGKVMDRLLCGDVGFGKTEVAFRAAFRAIVNHKQVAFLAPTTILTQQHYNTAINRFKDFGVSIEVINRFKKPAEQKAILQRLKDGKIDMIIGTHRLISKDIEFKDLGLLILDEEQRFGVEHKEKIKLLKKNVDTLTLSATPIPRTLHMSLSGIRDISTLNTPPKERIPVQTYVTEETETLLTDAILREVSRGGQVFVLYNRVETIYTFAKKLQDLLPDVKFIVAHGQMEESALENSIMDFYDGKGDVLIATTIIENGIDLPKANTLIVIEADKLGLSTLYQLKGRVGRSNRLAHAYFTFKKEKVLTDVAYKRLNAIIEFAGMGSGFKIAMRDLEIRGAGNVLGREQHGHMDKVGYELYSKLLKEEMGEPIRSATELDVRVTAYIPDKYIESDAGRMDAYKEIAEISSIEDETRVRNALFDLYGDIPYEVENLIAIAVVKNLASKLGAVEVNIRNAGANLIFSDISAFSSRSLHDALQEFKTDCVISIAEKPAIEFSRKNRTSEDILFIMREFLEKCVYAKK